MSAAPPVECAEAAGGAGMFVSSIKHILRIDLVRSVLSSYKCGAKGLLQCQLVNEFRDTLHADLPHVTPHENYFDVMIVSAKDDHNEHSVAVVQTQFQYVEGMKWLWKFRFPEVEGVYKFVVRPALPIHAEIYVIQLETNSFVVSNNEIVTPSLMFPVYRSYSDVENTYVVKIREDFGATLGSHVWDTAIVLNRHLKYCLEQCDVKGHHKALELGGGCGLVGIALGLNSYFEHVLITDKLSEQHNILGNINLNDAQSKVSGEILDWGSDADIQRSKIANTAPIDLIIASDVLYDIEAALLLFDVLHNLSYTNHTKILLGQKLRSLSTSQEKRFDVKSMTNFSSEVILEEGSVVVWKLEKII